MTFCVPLSLLMLKADRTLRLMEASTPLVSEFSALMKSHQYCCFFTPLCPAPPSAPSTFQNTYNAIINALCIVKFSGAAILRVALHRKLAPSLFVQSQPPGTLFNLKIHLPHQPQLQIGAATAVAVRITQSQTQLCHKEKFNL